MYSEPLAIVGMACRFPGCADSAESLWRMLCNGTDAICDVPVDRWDVRKFFDPDPEALGKGYTLQGGFLHESIWHFDPGFFGISPREASVMDPQQRLMLEVTWEAFGNAGVVLTDAVRKRTGVFVGAFCFDNAVQQLSQPSREAISSHTATSASMVMLSNRISYVFDLQGPSFTVDTACSSSLVATHLGCTALLNDECDVAIVGGVNVMLRPESTILECKGGFLAHDARCRTFDASAGGYVRAEGAGVVVIRKLSQAMAQGDRIYAVIRGSGVNQDGRTPGITVPNGEAQRELIRDVCATAGVDPSQIGLIEAHGTGTPVGDPIEANALGTVIGQGRDAGSAAWVGSIKTNLGHLEAAAGVAGLMKAALSLHHQQTPPHLHLVNVNPKIDLSALGLRVPRQLEALGESEGRFACVNSFGYGGTNAHVILERPPRAPQARALNDARRTWLLPLSAKSESGLAAYTRSVAERLKLDGIADLARFGHAAAVRRAHHEQRTLISARSVDELREVLDRIARGERDPRARSGRAREGFKMAWVFTGMGAQWWGMGRTLYESQPAFRNAILGCDAAWRMAGGGDLSHLFEFETPAQGQPMPEPKDAQPLNLALQIGVTTLLRNAGLEPDAIVGHSVGEIGAAWAAGVLTVREAFKLTYHRSRLQQELLGAGTMMAASAPAAVVREGIHAVAPDVEIAAFNDQQAVTLGGREVDLQKLADWARDKGISTQMLKVGVAYHTRQMEPIGERFKAVLADLETQAPRIELFSTVTGARVVAGEQQADYWWRNAREPVLLADAMELMRKEGFNAFVEIGPHAVLGASILRNVPDSQSWPSQRRGADEEGTLYAAVADAYCAGASIDWAKHYPLGDPSLRMPSYPFQREELWRETSASRADRLVEELHPLLHQRLSLPKPTWRTTLNERFLPWLADHKIAGTLVFPGAGYAIAALAAAKESGRGDEVEAIEFRRALDPRSQTSLQIDLDARDGAVSLHSQQPGEANPWVLHATARIPEGRSHVAATADLGAIRSRCRQSVDPDSLYRQLAEQGLQYGPAFQCIVGLDAGAGEALVALRSDDAKASEYLLHPALLDAALQSLIAVAGDGVSVGTYVPVSIRRIRLHHAVGQEVLAHVRLSRRGADSLQGEIVLLSAQGQVLAEIEAVRCQSVGASRDLEAAPRNIYAWQWETAAPVRRSSKAGRWLVLKGRSALGQKVTEVARSELHVEVECESGSFDDAPVEQFAGFAGVLDLRAADVSSETGDAGQAACASLLLLANKLATLGSSAPRLVVATHCAQPVGDMVVAPSSGAIWGLGRVLMTEYPALRVRLVDCDSATVDPESLFSEALAEDAENEVVLRRDRMAPRLDRWAAPPSPLENRSLDEPARLVLGTPGVLESLHWVPDARRKPGPGEVEVRVHCTSLNFKDLMKALNMLSSAYMETTFIGQHLGMELSGTVVAVGEGVTEYAPGDAVIAIDTNGCFRSYHTVGTGYLFHKPEALTFECAPALIAYVTPYYALKYLANVQPGESVLIHSASGGVGLAAIEVARWLGAEVIATAGSEAKRAFLHERGVKHVFDSRTLEFADQVLGLTERRGVDVVLNSLSSEAARKSLAILASHGRFIEIGKRDIAEGGVLGLADFDRNLMYAAVDTDRMGAERPALFRRLISEVLDLLAGGKLAPVPSTAFAASDVAGAFRSMARAQHVGKIVVDLHSGAVPLQKPTGVRIRDDRTWLVTGGLGGFGLEVAKWLVRRGARHLMLVGRTGASRPEAQVAIDELQAQGVVVVAEAADVSERRAVDRLIKKIGDAMPPLQGIVHGAMVLDDAPLAELDAHRLSGVMKPKALGAWHLHQATAGMPLEAFVMCSSVATFIGNASQGAYVAANGFLDALAWHRRALGLPGLTVNWGAISDTGVVARSDATAAYLDNMGIGSMPSAACLAVLEHLLLSNAAQVGVAEMNWARWAATAGDVVRSPRFSRVVAAAGTGDAELPPAGGDLVFRADNCVSDQG